MCLERVVICFVFFCSVLTAGTALAEEQKLVVSAAMSLKNAFTEIGKSFEKNNPGLQIYFNFASSGDLERQIENGAPVDVYASASQKFMNMLEEKNGIVSETRTDFARNTLALIVPAGKKSRLTGFADLPRAANIAIGNPKTVPAGRYAAESLRFYKLYAGLQNRMVFAEHVRQVLDYVARDEVDAGIVYATDARMREKQVTVIQWAAVESHTPVLYPIAVVRETKNRKAAGAFVRFVSAAPEARAVLQRYGFAPVQ